MARPTVRLATRGSDLARRQTAEVAEALEARRFEVEVVEVSTRGDRVRDELIHRLGKTGAFVRSLDEEVLSGDLDAAVHSMKDMPTESPEELVVAAVPERGTPGDVLVTPDGGGIEDLPEGATVGTSSLRRRAQLLARRPDLTVEPLRGNVDTRVEKLLAPHRQREHERRLAAEEDDADDEGDGDDEEFEVTAEEWFAGLPEIERSAMGRQVETEFDAIVLAEVGLQRLGLADDLHLEALAPAEFVPAPGQGAIAVTARDSELAERLHDVLDHPRTRVETTVERTVLATLGGGCVAPIGVYAVLQGEHVRTTAVVLGRDGEETVEESRDLPVERHAEAAREFARDLDAEGAGKLVDRARAGEDEDREAKRGDGSDGG